MKRIVLTGMINPDRSNFNERTNWVYLAIFMIASVSLFIKFSLDKHLALDGVGYFYHILEKQNFADIAWSRRFTEYLTEWPLVLAVRLGVTDITILIDIFAMGIYFPYLLSFLLCWYAVRDEDKSLLWFPLAGYIGFNILSDYDLIADHHVMALMTWPIMLMLLKSRPMRWREGVILWVLLILYSRMYEAAVLTAGILFLVNFIRLFHFPILREKIISGISLLLLAVVIIISAVYIFNPRSPENRGSFLESIWVNKRNWEAMATYGFMLIFSLGWIVSERWIKTKNILFVASLIPISYYVYLRLTTDYAMTAYISFSSRSLIGVVIPGLIVLAAIIVGLKRTLGRNGIATFLVVFLVMTIFNLVDLRNWAGMRDKFIAIVSSDLRYVYVDETPLENSHYRWSWNNPLLSLVWSSPCVKTIILNTPDDPQGPFDPRKRLVLKRYLKYDNYYKRIDTDITVCPG